MRNSTYRPLSLHTKEKYESKLSVVGLQKHNAQPGLDKPHILAVFKSLNVGRYFASQPGPTLPDTCVVFGCTNAFGTLNSLLASWMRQMPLPIH